MNISRIYRLLKLITILQGNRRYTADELADELEVSRRTVFRDLNMLEMAHIPYYFDEKEGGYRISKRFFLQPINLTLSEALSMLLLAGRASGRNANIPLLDDSTRAAMKLEGALPRNIREHVGSVIDRVQVTMEPVSRHEGLDDIFDRLVDAVQSRWVCRLVYLSFHERKQLDVTVRPLKLVFVSRAWYLIAYTPRFKENRTYKLARIRKLTVTDHTFQAPQNVDLDDHFGQAWRMIPEGELHDVHLHFTPKVAGNVAEVQWHDTQRVEWNEDGSIEFRVTVDGLNEIAWWILGYGDQVEVISPPTLRSHVADVAESMVKKYRKEVST